MKRATIIVGVYLILLLSALMPAQKTAAPASGRLPPATQSIGRVEAQVVPRATPLPRPEARALWVVRSSLVSPEAVKELVRRAKENGFTDLVVQVRGRGDAYYASSVEPRAEDLLKQPASFDPLALTIDEAHQRGVRVHAWINIYLVANLDPLPRNKNHLIYQHPEWLMTPRGLAADLNRVDPNSPDYLKRLVEYTRANRREMEGLFVSPANPEVKQNVFNIWMDVAEKYQVDGLHFDYVRYPNPEYDYSRVSLDLFREEIEKTLGEEQRRQLATQFETDQLIYATTFPDRYAQFQRDQVTDLVERIYRGVKRIKPYALISAAVFANEEDAARSRFQDWKVWLQRGCLDVVCPMAYTPDTETFRKQILTAVNNSAGKQVWGGIGAYKQTAESALEKIKATRELGAQGYILFSYDSSIKVSDLNPQGDYLERVRDALQVGSKAVAR